MTWLTHKMLRRVWSEHFTPYIKLSMIGTYYPIHMAKSDRTRSHDSLVVAHQQPDVLTVFSISPFFCLLFVVCQFLPTQSTLNLIEFYKPNCNTNKHITRMQPKVTHEPSWQTQHRVTHEPNWRTQLRVTHEPSEDCIAGSQINPVKECNPVEESLQWKAFELLSQRRKFAMKNSFHLNHSNQRNSIAMKN